MFKRIAKGPYARVSPVVFASGVFLILASVLGLVLGLMLIQSLTRDFETSIEVSRSAITSVGDTLEVVDDLAHGATDSIESGAQSASSASDAARGAVAGLEDIGDFLESDLPESIEAIQLALPGAINAADAVDTALGALSLLGVDYSPQEPFGDSLRGVRATLATLPDDIRTQSESVRRMVPLTNELADDVGSLALSLEELRSGMGSLNDLTTSYDETVARAEMAIEQTDASLDRTALLFRLILILVTLSGALIGSALISIERRLGRPVVGD